MLNSMKSQARPRNERGAAAIIVAVVTCFVLFIVAALTVDIGRSWARRGELQSQVDKAALFAGNYLPASEATGRLRAAKAAIHYLACHPVAGQVASVNPGLSIPRNGQDGTFYCPSPVFDPASSTYNAAALAAMSNNVITFPNKNEISIQSPSSKIDFGFGTLMGVNSSVQTKSATAHVYSPGGLVPMGGSVGCLAAAANNTQLLGLGTVLQNLIPINYFSAGDGSNSLSGTGSGLGEPPWPAAPPTPSGAGRLEVESATPNSSGDTLAVTYSIQPNLPGLGGVLATALTNLVGTSVVILFRKLNSDGTTSEATATGSLTLTGNLSVAMPSAVRDTPGEWYVRVELQYPKFQTVIPGVLYLPNGSDFRKSNNALPITVGASTLSDLTDLDNLLSCAKPVISPRSPAGTDSADMIQNIRNGIDHGLGQHPSLVTAAQGLGSLSSLTLPALLTKLSGPSSLLFSCAATDSVNIPDIVTNRANTPNCLRVNTEESWSYEFTQGFLTPDGRFSCARSECRFGTFNGSEFGLGGTYNADKITDYISDSEKQSVLDDMLFTSLDTFLLPSIPLLTPANTLSSGIYESPRFFWAPVLTTVFTTDEDAFYPVLTFRPTFVTEETPSVSAGQQLINALAVETINELRALIASGISQLLGGVLLGPLLAGLGLDDASGELTGSLSDPDRVEKYGLVFDTGEAADSKLKALRVMNINPGALPAVNPDYDGPVSDYLGSGPKIIRLVK